MTKGGEVIFIIHSKQPRIIHETCCPRITLTKEGFEDFHKLVSAMGWRPPLPFRLPLDERVWLSFNKDGSVQLSTHSPYYKDCMFLFSAKSWKN